MGRRDVGWLEGWMEVWIRRRIKVWIGHLVSPIRPTLCPRPSLSGQQTLQHWQLVVRKHYSVPRSRCIIPGDSIATAGWRSESRAGTPSSPKWQINKLADPWSQLWPKVFYHLSTSLLAPFPSFAVLQLFNKSCSFCFEGGSNRQHFGWVSLS